LVDLNRTLETQLIGPFDNNSDNKNRDNTNRDEQQPMNTCPYCNEFGSRPIAQAVETNNREVVVLVSCPSCLNILGVTRL
jgi:hypothetical protein